MDQDSIPWAPVGSQSALRVALRRAAHQLFDRPVLFDDPYAVPLLGPAYAEALARTPVRGDRPWSRAARAFAVARQRYAEERLARAVGRGVRRFCLLGAGLDTFAWRNPYPDVRVWEVDRAEMLAWKSELAARAGFPEPRGLVRVPIDLGQESLPDALTAAGLRCGPAFFSLLGVAPYLECEVFRATVQLVEAHGAGSGVVLDYRLPRTALGDEEQRQHDSLAGRVAQAGEPFRSAWTPEQMVEELSGFRSREELDCAAINLRYFAGGADALAAKGEAVRLISASV